MNGRKVLNVPYLWVNAEPFDLGIIPVPLPSKLTHHNLRKLHTYAKSKGSAGYPKLTYPIWQHVACNKLMIEEHLAWTYFHTCLLLIGEDENGRSTNKDKDLAKEKQSVDLLKFLLYLFIQHSQVISLKSAVITGDEYPNRGRLQDLEGKAAIGTKGIDEYAQMSYIATNITDILDLLVEPDAAWSENTLSVAAVDSLGFLISSTLDGRCVLPLGRTASNEREAQKAGYSKTTGKFSCRRLQSWIKAYLQHNPFGILACLTWGQKLHGRGYSGTEEREVLSTSPFQLDWNAVKEPLLNDTDMRTKSSQVYSNRIFSNINFEPTSHMKRLIFNQACKQTVARCGPFVSGTTVNIHRCQNSHLYLLDALRSVVIEKCHNSTIFLGVAQLCVRIIACENIRLIGVAKQLVVISSQNCSFYVCVNSEPVLIGKNDALQFAPYFTHYPHLEVDMRDMGVKSEPNYWNLPIILGARPVNLKNIWSEVATKNFIDFVVPFAMEGNTKECPMVIPKRYLSALLERESRIDEWRQLIIDAGISKSQRDQLQAIVIERFDDWLKETGNSSLLKSLNPPIPPTPNR